MEPTQTGSPTGLAVGLVFFGALECIRSRRPPGGFPLSPTRGICGIGTGGRRPPPAHYWAMKERLLKLSDGTEVFVVLVSAFGLFAPGNLAALISPEGLAQATAPPISNSHLQGLVLYEGVVVAILATFLRHRIKSYGSRSARAQRSHTGR